jgi:protein KRI1
MNLLNDSDTETDTDLQLKINKGYAKRFEHNKKRQELQTLKEKYKDNESDEDSSEYSTEDEQGNLMAQNDEKLLKTISLIKNKDYDALEQLSSDFDEQDDSDGEAKAAKKDKKISIQDYQRNILLDKLKNQEKEPESKFSYNREQVQLKNELIAAVKVDESDDLFTVKKDAEGGSFKSKSKKDTEKYIQSLLDKGENKDQKFLLDYVLNKGWVGVDDVEYLHEDTDEEEEERMEQYETEYNFRYEEPGAELITTHSREQPYSVRRKDSSRTEKRKEIKERKELEKTQKIEELKRLKNLKKQEIQEKLKQIKKMAGGELIGIDRQLEDEFDSQKYDEQMEKVFNEDYYAKVDQKKSGKPKKPKFKDDIDIDDLLRKSAVVEDHEESNEYKPDKALDQDVLNDPELEKHINEYYQLSYSDIIGNQPIRFKYRSVPAESYSLKPEEILEADDEDLNNVVSLKKLAPFRSQEKLRADESRWKKTKKKKLWEFRQKLAGKRQGIMAGSKEDQNAPEIEDERLKKAKISKSRLDSYATSSSKRKK